MTHRLTPLRVAAAALAVAAVLLNGLPAWAFTIETLGSGNSGGGSRFSDPDNQTKNFGQGTQLFGPGGPMMQFGVQPGVQSPFGPRGPLMPPGFATPRSYGNDNGN